MTGNKSDKGLTFLMFFLWPIFGLILAVKNFNRLNTKPVIYFFCALFGFTMVVDEELDSSRYLMRFQDEYRKPFIETQLYKSLTGLYETSIDFFEPLVTYLVSRFTDSGHILFAIYALIFAFFWLKTIDLVNKKYDLTANDLTIAYTVLFIAVIPIFYVTGFRMWTAAWVFLYGALQVLLFERRLFILVAFSSIFIHFSFFVACLVLLAWMIFGNHKWVYLGLALATLTLKELDLAQVKEFAGFINAAAERRASSYGSEGYVKQIREMQTGQAWFIVLSEFLTKYLLLLNLIILLIKSEKYEMPKADRNMLSFCLLFFAYANLASFLPSGERFLEIFKVLAAVTTIILVSKYFLQRLESLYGLASVAMVTLVVLITLRISAPTINTVIFTPGMMVPFGYNLDWSLLDWLF